MSVGIVKDGETVFNKGYGLNAFFGEEEKNWSAKPTNKP